MSVFTLDLNDSGISVFEDTRLLVNSPGVAVQDGCQIYMGKDAQRRSRLFPTQLNHRFWSQLSLDHISRPLGNWHRYADIAHAHLQAISVQAKHPKEIILAVPGSYQPEQLALLLGICRECSFNAVGLVDSALAACVNIESPFARMIHLDLQMHQALLTRFEKVGSRLQRTNVLVLPSVGLLTLYDKWARYIAKECIRQTRFDPLHTAQAEQTLYNSLNKWITGLHQREFVNVEINGHSLRLNRQSLLSATKAEYDNLYKALAVDATAIVLSHRVAGLPGFALKVTRPLLLPEDSVAHGVCQTATQIRSEHSDLEFVTAMQCPQPALYAANDSEQVAKKTHQQASTVGVTHILFHGQAYPLLFQPVEDVVEDVGEYWIATHVPATRNGLSLDLISSSLSDREEKGIACRILRSSDRIWLHIEPGSESAFTVHRQNGHEQSNDQLHCGDGIVLADSGQQLTLIQVTGH